jgi:hypothetical protein
LGSPFLVLASLSIIFVEDAAKNKFENSGVHFNVEINFEKGTLRYGKQ